MRCVAGQSTLLFCASWAFVVWFAHYGDDSVELILPWVLHGVASTVVIVFCSVMELKGIVNGNKISKRNYGYAATALAVMKALLILCILAFVVDLEIREGQWFEFFVFFLYYTAMEVPGILALASFKRQQGSVEWLDQSDQKPNQ